jgi:hypothetical protein
VAARIPIFLSAPTILSAGQQASYDFILDTLAKENFEPRALGRTDFGSEFPLKEVYSIARHCSGGVILGYEQMRASEVTIKPGTPSSMVISDVPFSTPWNNLEAGILFALKLPLMVFREDGIQGGIFDNGVSNAFVQRLPSDKPTDDVAEALGTAVKNWAGKVREHYRAY